MDKEKLLNQLIQKDNSERWYLIGFFSVFILLILFVIRPNVNEYLRRQKLRDDLIETNVQYDKAITNLRILQTLFEEHRDEFPLLEEAVPLKLDAYKFSQDVAKVFLPYLKENEIEFAGFSVGEKADAGTPLKNTKLIPYPQSVEISGRYGQLLTALNALMNQRRIKHVTNVVFTKTQSGSESASMTMKVDFQGYHLKN
ncbi:MAG: type 4a pilus biogenesis protein PilO [Patescibacteria group bacterium]